MAEASRKKGESFEAMMRRFNDRVKKSGMLLETRKIRFHSRPFNKSKTRMIAKRRRNINAKQDYLRKSGKIKDERY